MKELPAYRILNGSNKVGIDWSFSIKNVTILLNIDTP